MNPAGHSAAPAVNVGMKISALASVIALSGIAVLVTWLAAADWIRSLFGLPALLLGPGYAFLMAFAPEAPLDPWELGTWVVALSIAFDICDALVLGATGAGINAASVAVSLACVSTGAAAVGMSRLTSNRHPTGSVRQPTLAALPLGGRRLPRLGPGVPAAILATAVALALTAGALVGSTHSATSAHGRAFNSISLLAIGPSTVKVTVENHGLTERAFRIAVSAGSSTIGAWAGIHVSPGRAWSRDIALPTLTGRTEVQAILFPARSSIPYIRAHLYVS